MRKSIFSILAMLCCGMVAFGLTSCLGDDDDDYQLPTAAERAAAIQPLLGYHDGKMIYSAPSTNSSTDRTDTLSISWNIKTDSTMTIYNFPLRVMAPYLSSEEMQKAILEADPVVDLNCSILVVKTSPVVWYINPSPAITTLSYSGASHELKFGFYGNTGYSFGQYATSTTTGKSLLSLQIICGGLYVDGLEMTSFSTDLPFVFYAN